MTARVITFGCQMNQHDSERISDVLDAAGFARAETNEVPSTGSDLAGS